MIMKNDVNEILREVMKLEPKQRMQCARVFACVAREIVADSRHLELSSVRLRRGRRPGRN